MIFLTFKNLEKSEMAREIVFEKLEPVLEKFDLHENSRVRVTLEMERSNSYTGPDLFKVTLVLNDSLYKELYVQHSATSLYVALNKIVDELSENLIVMRKSLQQASHTKKFQL